MASNKIFNTGVNEMGIPLPPKSIDPHWAVIHGPGITNPQRVFVLADQHAGTYFQTPDSKWVWANTQGKADTSAVYVFQTRFFVEVDPGLWIRISGKWGADNFGQITIDRNPLPPGSLSGDASLPPGNVVANYGQPHSFSISQGHVVSLLGPIKQWRILVPLNVGWHTLEAWIYNEGPTGSADPSINPAGFNLSALQFDTQPVPHIQNPLPNPAPNLHHPGS